MIIKIKKSVDIKSLFVDQIKTSHSNPEQFLQTKIKSLEYNCTHMRLPQIV